MNWSKNFALIVAVLTLVLAAAQCNPLPIGLLRSPAPPEEAIDLMAAPTGARERSGEVSAELRVEDAAKVTAVTEAEAPPEAASGLAASDGDEAAGRGDVQQVQPLRAGEVDDNALWDDYLLYRRRYGGPIVHDVDVNERYVIEVRDEQGRPLLGTRVTIFAGDLQGEPVFTGRTYATGQTLFHPSALNLPEVNQFTVWVERDGQGDTFVLDRYSRDTWPVTLKVIEQNEPLNLDLLFLIDATGSMSDEIAKIQDSIFDVAARIDALPTQPNVRYGLVTYRDRGDAYVTRAYEFAPDVNSFHNELLSVVADGGGDYPESLNEGLHDALTRLEWRTGEAVQLIFLVADAPPHLDYPQDYDYAQEMVEAVRRGIKIFPIASSGLDDQGEYIFRQLAQFTQGRFVFLTYADATNGGAPGDETTHHVAADDYTVDNLDNLLVKLVTEELAHQDARLAQRQ